MEVSGQQHGKINYFYDETKKWHLEYFLCHFNGHHEVTNRVRPTDNARVRVRGVRALRGRYSHMQTGRVIAKPRHVPSQQ
jgi:hypothetical protein